MRLLGAVVIVLHIRNNVSTIFSAEKIYEYCSFFPLRIVPEQLLFSVHTGGNCPLLFIASWLARSVMLISIERISILRC